MNIQTIAMPRRRFLDLSDFSRAELRGILDLCRAIKKQRVKGRRGKIRPLEGRTLAMIFDKPSTRTRVSFDVGMRELGGETIMLTGAEMQLGRGETIADTARVLSRFVDAIMIRILEPRAPDGSGGQCHGPRDQRPHQEDASLPGDGGYHDLRGASRRRSTAPAWPGSATPATC